MLDPDLPEDLSRPRDTAERFAKSRTRPGYGTCEQEVHVDRALVRGLGEPGIVAPELPEAYGGSDWPATASITPAA
jgi:cyclohexanecarboxyl-CoA dehydrogenase